MKKLLIPLLITNIIYAQSFVPDAPELDLKSYILIEPNTNTVIAEFNSDSEIEPASMTKIMTSYVVADQIANDLISLDDLVIKFTFSFLSILSSIYIFEDSIKTLPVIFLIFFIASVSNAIIFCLACSSFLFIRSEDLE